jgi:hypothetical protein
VDGAGDIFARLLVAAHHINGDRQHADRGIGGVGSCRLRQAYSVSSTSAGFSMTRLPR